MIGAESSKKDLTNQEGLGSRNPAGQGWQKRNRQIGPSFNTQEMI